MTKANTQPSAISKSIAQHLQSVRKGRGLSLDKTAKLTGVSKAMLGQIERGESSPTIATLWKIATGLECSFSSFLSVLSLICFFLLYLFYLTYFLALKQNGRTC